MAAPDVKVQVKLTLSGEFVGSAKVAAEGECRSLPKQIEYWARLGQQEELRRTHLRLTTRTGADPYDDLEARLAEQDDWATTVIERQRAAGIPVWSIGEDGNLVSS